MSYRPTPKSPPPLHHPVPQHPVHFQAQQTSEYAANPTGFGAPVPGTSAAGRVPEQSSAGGYGGAPFGFDSFLQDPKSQMGLELGRSAFSYGQEYIGKNVEQYVKVNSLRYYFQVSNSYVLRKVLLVLFPWRHKPWSRQLQRTDTGAAEGFALPRDDINAPDMYVPTVALTTWLLLFSLVRGVVGDFQIQLLGMLTTKALVLIVLELLFLQVFTYLLAASSRLLDFAAYSGYKFVPVTVVTLATALSSNTWVKWSVFLYTATATCFFLLRSLRYDLLAETSSSPSTVSGAQRQRKIQFLFIYAVVAQYFLMWLLV